MRFEDKGTVTESSLSFRKIRKERAVMAITIKWGQESTELRMILVTE